MTKPDGGVITIIDVLQCSYDITDIQKLRLCVCVCVCVSTHKAVSNRSRCYLLSFIMGHLGTTNS